MASDQGTKIRDELEFFYLSVIYLWNGAPACLWFEPDWTLLSR